MKKQIFILVLLVVAIFASINKSYGQEKPTPPAIPWQGTPDPVAPACLTPTPLEATLCAGNPLTPFVGVPYTYEVNVPTPIVGTKTYKWFVTTDKEFIKKDPTTLSSSITATIEKGDGSDDHILAVGSIGTSGFGSYNSDDENVDGNADGNGVGTTKIQMSWNYWVHNPANPVFLVVYVTNDASCDNDNIEVYIIKPVHSFTLDIANVSPTGTVGAIGVTADGPCAAPVSTASWIAPDNDNPDGQIVVEHGVNYLYYMVTAANFNHSWLPSFQVSGDGIGDAAARNREITAIDWQYASESNLSTPLWNPTKVTYNGTTVGEEFYAATGKEAKGGVDVPVLAQGKSFVDSEGQCIIVRVTVANHKIETIDNPDGITLAVDGVMYNAAAVAATPPTDPYVTATFGDIHHTKGSGLNQDCPWTDLFANDKVTQNILIRPTITSNTINGNFIPKMN